MKALRAIAAVMLVIGLASCANNDNVTWRELNLHDKANGELLEWLDNEVNLFLIKTEEERLGFAELLHSAESQLEGLPEADLDFDDLWRSVSPNGRYFAVAESSNILVFDLQERSCIAHVPIMSSFYGRMKPFVFHDNHTLYFFGVDIAPNYVAAPPDHDGPLLSKWISHENPLRFIVQPHVLAITLP